MRTLQTSLLLLSTLSPALAWAQDVPADAPAEDPLAAEPAPAEPAPEPAAAPAPAPAASANTTASGQMALPSIPQGGPTSAGAPVESPSPNAGPPRSRGGGPESGKWNFNYAGYFRAPMRLGFGQSGGPQFVDPVTNPDGLVPAYGDVDQNGDNVPDGVGPIVDAAGNPLYHPKQLTIHQPVIPDDQYASWQFTGHNKKEWAEMFFSVGNGMVSGNLAVQAFRFTDAAWQDTIAQFGIGQGWVEINHDLGFENLKFNAKVGSHWNRYGLAGVYDSGEYDTYIVARTHVMGGTARADIDLGAASVGFEGGVGVNDANPDMNNRARFTTLAHGHGFLELPAIDLGVHLLHAWSAAEVAPNYPARLPSYEDETYDYESSSATTGGFLGGVDGYRGVWGPEYPNGSQTIAGLDVKFDLGLFGYLFAGYSHMFLSHALTVGDAIESVHSLGGGEYNIGAVDNYLESPYCPIYVTTNRANNRSCSDGNGTVGSAMLQYELGLANFGLFSGAQDLKLALYGMFNYVTVGSAEDDDMQDILNTALGVNPTSGLTLQDLKQDGTYKVKFGADAEFFLSDWFAIATRADHVRPHSKIAGQVFTVLSPRITFKTQAVTHEEISISYSHYFYENRGCSETNAAGQTVVASPAADPFPMTNSPMTDMYARTSPNSGLPMRVSCTQPAAAASYPYGFGSHTTNQTAGNRGSPTLLPDENVVKLEASIWW